MGQTDESRKNLRLEHEFSNPVYDVVGKAISATAKKHDYKKYDVTKLVMAIYDKDYGFITSEEDYRDQVKLLDEYFEKAYSHRLITFEMIKTIKIFQGTDIYDALTADIASIEALIRTQKQQPAEDLCLFSQPLDDNHYDELMTKIENESSLKYAVAIIYDKIKNIEK